MFLICGVRAGIETMHLKTSFKRTIKGYWYTIYIFDSDLVWRMQLMIIKGQK